MRYEVVVGGRRREVLVTQEGDGLAVAVDGRVRSVDAARIDAQRLSLIMSSVSSKGDTRSGNVNSAAATRVQEVAVLRDRGPEGLTVRFGAATVSATLNDRRRRANAAPVGGSQRIVAPMPGKIVRVLVKPGDTVRARQPLLVVEAMKMENELRAEEDAIVAEIHAKEGASVDAGALLIVLE